MYHQSRHLKNGSRDERVFVSCQVFRHSRRLEKRKNQNQPTLRVHLPIEMTGRSGRPASSSGQRNLAPDPALPSTITMLLQRSWPIAGPLPPLYATACGNSYLLPNPLTRPDI